MDTAADGIITIDESGLIESFNPASEVIFGYRKEEAVGQNVRLLMPEPDHLLHDSYMSRILSTRDNGIIGQGREVEGLRKDGSKFPMDLSVGVVDIGGAKIFTGIVRDITERKITEASLSESIRLASIGELAAGVAHEINNPLGVAATTSNAVYIADTLNRRVRRFTTGVVNLVDPVLRFEPSAIAYDSQGNIFVTDSKNNQVYRISYDGRFEVKAVHNGYDAGLQTERFRPHLIVLDYMLPDINGNIVCERVRQMPHMQHTKIICVSGVVNQEEVQDLMRAGADDFIKKPFDIREVVSRMTDLLGISESSSNTGVA